MSLRFLVLLSCLFLISCQNSAFVQTAAANETLTRMNNLQKGMSSNQVKSLLGCPKKILNKIAFGRTYTVWYYVTQGVVFSQTNYYQINFTPIVFYHDKLFGWGKAFYYNLFRLQVSTQGHRGGDIDTIYYYKKTDGSADQSIEDILEEMHEEKSLQPLSEEQKEKPAKEKPAQPESEKKSEMKYDQEPPAKEEQAPAFWE